MHERILPRSSTSLLDRLEKPRAGTGAGSVLAGWTLAGGTGLALSLGHRISDDLDFFQHETLDNEKLHATLNSEGPYETLQESDTKLITLVRGTRLSFYHLPYPHLFPPRPYRTFAVADPRDITQMKLLALSIRGSRRDFVDLYAALRGEDALRGALELLPRKFGAGRINVSHILKSLTYFEDAEAEPMPQMRDPFDWDECKSFFVREAHALVLPPAGAG